MKIEKQLSVFLENRPGALARIAGILSAAGVNILALSIHDTIDHAVVRLLVDNPLKAVLLLEQDGLHINEREVVVIDLDNRPGKLLELAQRLARADINIDYAYCATTSRQPVCSLVLRTDHAERAIELLSGLE